MSQLFAIQQVETDRFDGWHEVPRQEADKLKRRWDAIYPNNTHVVIRSPTKDGFKISDEARLTLPVETTTDEEQ